MSWALADWMQTDMDPVADAIKVQRQRDACSAAAQALMPGGRSVRPERRRVAATAEQLKEMVHGPQPTKLRPGRPKICLPTVLPNRCDFFFYLLRPNPISPKDSASPSRLLRTRRASLRHAVKSIELSCSSTNTNSESHPARENLVPATRRRRSAQISDKSELHRENPSK